MPSEPNPEVIQTQMMARMLQEKANNDGKLRARLRERKIPKKSAPEVPKIDEEIVESMRLLIPAVLRLYTSSPSWLIRDRALECLRLAQEKLGKEFVKEHLEAISDEKRTVLERALL
ncbi:unnamed protein product [Caenorhabditis sp. 36 PRJEB53466]|nr:unnamed protein product [Caenorhabditis sp. 36 PRJEB53466]